MDTWQEKALQLCSRLEQAFDSARLKFKQNSGLLDDIIIQPYRGYGNDEVFYVNGRVLEAEGLDIPPEDASLWDNLKSLYHRYESDEVPNAPVKYEYFAQEGQMETNEEGYFSADIKNEQKLTGWQPIRYKLMKQYKSGQPPVEIESEILLHSPASSYGIISDLDDTVIVSQATSFLEKSRILLLNNERTRKPFEGVASFYKALQAGRDKQRQNPVFYLSNASWNLYDMFNNFCQINGLPKGVFMLRDVGLDKQKLYRKAHDDHKFEKINKILETFKALPFTLIGDSGQQDPEVYEQVVKKHPGRILAIYIRDVNPEENQARDQEVKAIAARVQQTGTPMLLVANSLEAARHAATLDLIPETVLTEIEHETRQDALEVEDIGNTLGLHKLLG